MEIVFLLVYSVSKVINLQFIRGVYHLYLRKLQRKAVTISVLMPPAGRCWFICHSHLPVLQLVEQFPAVYLWKNQSLGCWSVRKRPLICAPWFGTLNWNWNKKDLSLPLLSGLSDSGNTRSLLAGSLELPLPVLNESRSGETWKCSPKSTVIFGQSTTTPRLNHVKFHSNAACLLSQGKLRWQHV